MNKYYLPIMLLIAVAIIGLSAKPSWVIHGGTSPAELGARCTDIENNIDTATVTKFTVTNATITTATVTTDNVTTGNITTLRAGTTDITAGDSLTANYFRCTVADITTGDTIKTTYLRAGAASDIIGADSVTATLVKGTNVQSTDTTGGLYLGTIGGAGYRLRPSNDSLFIEKWVTNAYVRCTAFAP